VGLLVADPLRSGWSWFSGGAAVLAAVAAALIVIGAARTYGHQAPSWMRVFVAALGLAGTALVLNALRPREFTASQAGAPIRIEFDPLIGDGPVLVLLGLALGVAGLARTGPLSRRRTGARELVLFAAGAALALACFMPWTWADASRVNTWELYEWADTALVILAAAIALCAASPRHTFLIALPVAAVAIPLVDAGDILHAPAGIRGSATEEGTPVGSGLILAVLSIAVATGALLPRRPSIGGSPGTQSPGDTAPTARSMPTPP
jgi:hypothetical protein